MQTLIHNPLQSKYPVTEPEAEIPLVLVSLTESLIRYRHNVSPALARLIVRENYGGEA